MWGMGALLVPATAGLSLIVPLIYTVLNATEKSDK
jgi:hypothetical protein